MIRRPPRSTQSRSSAASDVYKKYPLFKRFLAAPPQPQVRHLEVHVVEVEALADGDGLARLDPSAYLVCHVLLEQLYAGEVRGEAAPEVPGAEVEHEVQFLLIGVDARVYLAKAGRVGQEDTLRVADRHAGLVGAEAILFVHADDLADLGFEIGPIGIVLALSFRVGTDELLEVAVDELHVGWWRQAGPLRHRRDYGPGLRVIYLDDRELELAPLLSLVGAAVYDILAAVFHDLVKALEPRVGYVARFDECYIQCMLRLTTYPSGPCSLSRCAGARRASSPGNRAGSWPLSGIHRGRPAPRGPRPRRKTPRIPVSYTHLTLPTIYSV